MLYPVNTTINEQKLFHKNSKFNEFKDITQERKMQIETLAHKFKKGNIIEKNSNLLLHPHYCLYSRTLEYLVNKNMQQLHTLDEKIFFLIDVVDPYCNMYELYLSCPNDFDSDTTKSVIRKNMGFFSSILLKYEYPYMKQFIPRLITNVNKDYSKKFTILAPLVNNFDDITNERFEQIQSQAILYKEIPNINHNFQTCIYNILYQAHVLELTNMQEKLIFFINVMDPELILLKIYYEESTNNNIKKRATKELGFFYPCLIKTELLYYNRFQPNKKISEWTI